MKLLVCWSSHYEGSLSAISLAFHAVLTSVVHTALQIADTSAGIAVLNTIIEVIQGPCVKNQEHFAMNTELIETLNRLMRAKAIHDCQEGDEIEYKKVDIDDTFQEYIIKNKDMFKNWIL